MTVERSSMNMQIRNISSISSVYSFVIEEWNRYRILLLKELVQLAGITGDALWNDIFQSNLFHSLFLFDPYSTILQLVSDQLERIMMVVHILILQDRFVNTVHFHIEMVLFLMQGCMNASRRVEYIVQRIDVIFRVIRVFTLMSVKIQIIQGRLQLGGDDAKEGANIRFDILQNRWRAETTWYSTVESDYRSLWRRTELVLMDFDSG